MHRCSSAQGNMVGACTCGVFHPDHGDQATSPAFSMLFSAQTHNHCPFEFNEAAATPAPVSSVDHYYPSTYFSSSSSVDCTLSLGTPSTRHSHPHPHPHNIHDHRPPERRRSNSSYIPNFCWASNNHAPTKTISTSATGSVATAPNNDLLFARRCANCDTTSTPLWRNGPRGPKVCIIFLFPLK